MKEVLLKMLMEIGYPNTVRIYRWEVIKSKRFITVYFINCMFPHSKTFKTRQFLQHLFIYERSS